MLLRILLRDRVLDIEHVGSTAVPGMIAKPIIDILATVSDFEEAFECVPKIERIGYGYMGESGEFQQYYFIKGTPARYHLYVQQSSADIRGRIAFRDCLIRDREIASRYAQLKWTLAGRNATGIRAYQEGKREFIDQVVRMASRRA